MSGLTHFEGRGHAAHDGDGMLQAKLLQLDAKRIFFVFQVDAGCRRQELLTSQLDCRWFGWLRGRCAD